MVSTRILRPNRATLAVLFIFMGILLLVHFDGIKNTNAAGRTDQEMGESDNNVTDKTAGTALANCRYGIVSAEPTAWVIPDTGAGIFYKFNHPEWFGPMPENNAELIHMIRTKQKKTEDGEYLPYWYTNVPLDENLADLIRNNPGDIWIVGNEIERGPNPGDLNPKNLATDDIYAEVYVEAYHDVYNFIKSNDPLARVANAGLIQITPMRLQYLDIMWDAYKQKYGEPMPVDVWTIHAYVLPELDKNGQPNNIASAALGTNPALGKRASGGDKSLCPNTDVYCLAEHDDLSIFKDQIVAMRQWMKARGQQEKPLIVTEYGTLYAYYPNNGSCSLKDEFGNCFTNERVSQFMLDTFDYFNTAKDPELGYALDNYKLVQQWIWFSTKSSNGNSGNLLRNDEKKYNGVGETFKNHIRAEPVYKNLLIDTVSGFQLGQDQNGTSTARLAVTFRNDGNAAVDEAFDVTFYSDAALTTPIGTTAVTPLVRGCAARAYKAEVDWTGLTSGTHQFWVLLDSKNDIPEQPPGNSDNIDSGQVTVNNIPHYTLAVQIENQGIGSGGGVTISPDLPSYAEGTEVKLEAVPYHGWVFSGWDGTVQATEPIIKLNMTEDAVIVAKFTQVHYELNINLDGQGKVYRNPLKENYLLGEKVDLLAQPAENWYFAFWSGDINDNGPSIRLTFEKDISITAHFVKLPEGDKKFLPAVFAAN